MDGDPTVLVAALLAELASFACFSGLTYTLLVGIPRYPTVLAIDLTGNGASTRSCGPRPTRSRSGCRCPGA